MTRALRPITILLAAAALLVSVPAAQAAPAALQSPTNTCWLDVINDWVAHNPNVVGSYPIPCYTQAIQHLNALPDIKGYSSAPDDIQRALLAAIHDERRGPGGPGGASSGPGGASSGPGGASSGPGGASSGPGTRDPGTGLGSSAGSDGGSGPGSAFGVHDATSVPLPLIVLGALAVLLALAALATWVARRFQERRPQPAPAVSRRR